MNIEFTPNQFKTLLKLIYSGHWMLTAHKVKPDKVIDALSSHIYSFAEALGINDLVELDPESGKFYPTRQFEDLMAEYIDDYDNQTFWDELVERLADRDFLAKYGESAVKKMSLEERFANFQEFEERYNEEFTDHGLGRITIDDDKP